MTHIKQCYTCLAQWEELDGGGLGLRQGCLQLELTSPEAPATLVPPWVRQLQQMAGKLPVINRLAHSSKKPETGSSRLDSLSGFNGQQMTLGIKRIELFPRQIRENSHIFLPVLGADTKQEVMETIVRNWLA